MKQLLIAIIALTLSAGAMAQFHRGYEGGHWYGPRVGLSVGVGYPYYYGPPYYYGYAPYYYGAHESKLQFNIDEINNKYDYKISLVRHDKQLPRKQRRAEIKELKYERCQAIIEAKRDYYNGK